MSDLVHLEDADDDGIEASTVAAIAAPLLALGATWAVRKAMDAAYTRATGNVPPTAADRDASLRRVLVYAAVTAAAVAIVNVAIDRFIAPKQQHQG